MANLWGPKADGKNGVMSESDFMTFVLNSTNWRKNANLEKAIKNGYSYIQSHKGRDGGTSLQHNGKTIFHTTEGRGECTFFFTCADGQVASLIGIGEHSGSGTHTYSLVWHTPGWAVVGTQITT